MKGRWKVLWLCAYFACNSAAAICLNPFGCPPSNYNECVDDATRRPTDLGVRSAKQLCYEKFKKPEEDRAQAQREKESLHIALEWARLGSAPLADMKKALGEPTKSTGPGACAKVPGAGAAPAAGCITHFWHDARAGRLCVQPSPTSFDRDLRCYFRAEVPAYSLTGEQWARWVESF